MCNSTLFIDMLCTYIEKLKVLLSETIVFYGRVRPLQYLHPTRVHTKHFPQIYSNFEDSMYTICNIIIVISGYFALKECFQTEILISIC